MLLSQALVAEHPEVSLILTEGRERVWGNITTCSNEEGYLWEEGPNSFQPNDSMLKAAVRFALLPPRCSTARHIFSLILR